jgi:hypothetical protein
VEEADRHSVIIYVTSQLLQGPIEGLEEYTDGAEQHALTFFCESPAGCSSLPVTAKRINEAVPDIQVQLHDKLPYRISSSKPLKSEEPITVQALRRLTRRKSAPAAVPAEPIEIDLLADDDDESFNTATAINDDKHRLSMGARSSRRQVAKREMSFTYPFDGLLHSISLTASDQERLNEGEMLNDNLIEFYLR